MLRALFMGLSSRSPGGLSFSSGLGDFTRTSTAYFKENKVQLLGRPWLVLEDIFAFLCGVYRGIMVVLTNTSQVGVATPFIASTQSSQSHKAEKYSQTTTASCAIFGGLAHGQR